MNKSLYIKIIDNIENLISFRNSDENDKEVQNLLNEKKEELN